MTHSFCNHLFISLLIHTLTTTSNTLDISDFIFYYKTYQYTLEPSKTTILYNEDLQINITVNNISTFTLHRDNDTIVLDISNDNAWDEISSIQSIPSSPTSHSSRSLLQGGPPPAGKGPPGVGAPAQPGLTKQLLKIYTGIPLPKPYQQADTDCKAQGSVLASIENSQQNNNVMKECAKFGHNVACFLGLKSPFMQWSDGKNVVYRNWVPGQPRTDGINGDCVEIYPDGRWGGTNCEGGRSYICQKIEPGLASVGSGAPVGGGGGGGCHPNYGCGGGGGGQSMCGQSPCGKMRKQENEHDRTMRRRARRRKRERSMRQKWRERLGRLRKRKDRKLKRALQKLRRKHEREGATYSWIADLLQRKIIAMQGTGQMASGGASYRRRMMEDVDKESYGIHGIVKRCRIVESVYEVCLVYNMEDVWMNLMVRIVDKTMEREQDDRKGYREVVDRAKGWFDERYGTDNKGDIWAFNPIEGSLGYVMRTYEDVFRDYIHYFDEFGFDFNGVYVECSTDIDYLPFKMCLKRTYDDIVLYFEKNKEDTYDIEETYSFQAKEYIDDQFESNTFSFNSDSDWDELNVVNNMQSVIKCSHKLMIAEVCIQQYDNGQRYRASIKFKTKNIKRHKT